MLLSFIKTLGFVSSLLASSHSPDASFTKPFSELFSHKSHAATFKRSSISCLECHNFSIKSQNHDPLGVTVPSGYISGSRKRCHECHLGAVQFPRPNQCVLCHRDVQKIMPENHHESWTLRHGKMAQVNKESCLACHTNKTCSDCHLKKETLKPQVHPPITEFFTRYRLVATRSHA